MLKVTLSNLRAHKRRLIATFAAVALGVAFLAGVLIQTATLQQGFDDLFDTESASVDAVVRGSATITDDMDETLRARIDGSVLDQVRALPGVRDARADIRSQAIIIGKDGKELGTFGPPRQGLTWIGDPALSPFSLAEGRAPEGLDEVVLDRASAEKGDLAIGDRTRVLTPEPVEVTVVGLARFGPADSLAGATATLFSPEGAAAHLGDGDGKVDRIVVDADAGTSQATLVEELERIAPDGAEAISGEQFRLENRDAVDDVMGFLRPVLLAFALIALLVASFSIYNTFAIIVAQRTREAALLRAIGASRGQTLRAVLVEAILVGAVASAAGVGLGVGVAALLGVVLGGASLDLGNAMVLDPATLATCVAIGTAITAGCALGPAVRASRVAPMAALREAAVDRTGASVGRMVLGGLLAALGLGLVVWATATDQGMGSAAGGVAALVLAFTVLGPALAGPVGRVLGAPLRLRGVTGDLARQNAVRNPRRTASSSTALMIGVAIVALFTVLAASIKADIDHQVEDGFAGDLIATAGLGGTGFDPSIARDIAALPEVDASAGLGNAPMRVDGEDTVVGVSDPLQIAKVMDLDVRQGSLADLTGATFAVSTDLADQHGWSLGSKVPYEFLDGTTGQATVAVVFADTEFAGDLLSNTEFTQGHGAQVNDVLVIVDLADGVSLAAGRAAVERTVADVPTISVQDKAEFAATVGQQIDSVLYLVYGMLFLSILIALIGIANTLSLATFERTRELGLLRAVGQGRPQTRAMVRWESVVVAVYGTSVGLVVGIGGAWALVASSSEWSRTPFTVPGGQVTLVLVLGALAGIVAAIRPAARAARLDPLTAIAAA